MNSAKRAVLCVLFLGLGSAFAVADSLSPLDWSELHYADLNELRSSGKSLDMPRHRLMLAFLELHHRPDEAAEHLNQAQLAAIVDSDEAKLANVLQCSFAALQGRESERYGCASLADRIASISHPIPKALAHSQYAIWLAIQGQYASSFEFNLSAETLALSVGDSHIAAVAQNNQGVNYLKRGLPMQALRTFQNALKHAEHSSLPDKQLFLITLISNVASAHLKLGQIASASRLLDSVIAMPSYNVSAARNLTTEGLLAQVALAQNDEQAGLERLRRVLDQVSGQSNIESYAAALSILGELHMALGESAMAIDTFLRAQEYSERSKNPLRVSKTNLSFVAALISLQRYAEAEKLLERSIAALSTDKPSMILVTALDLRGDLLVAMGNPGDGNEAKRQSQRVQAQIVGAEYELELAVLSKTAELASKEQELAHSQREARLSATNAQRSITVRNFTILTALLVVLVGYLFISSRYDRKVARTVQQTNAALERKVHQRTQALEREMTQRLEAESERHALEQSLAESEKMQAIGRLTSGVAHDFNNLMTIVTISAGLLKATDLNWDGDSRQHLESILAAADSGSDITASLLAYARKQPLAPETTHLDRFIDESLSMFESTLGEAIAVIAKTEPCVISVDRGKLTTAMINLLLNAKEAMKGQGAVQIVVALETVTNKQGESQDWATVSVTDDGCGMSPAVLRRATEPFYTAKPVGHGTGLGLSMVDGFAKQSGGFLEIESVAEEGTQVTLYIPLAANASAATASLEAAGVNVSDIGVVLIVDDQPALRDILCRLLEQMGMETIQASSGAEALQILEGSAQPNLLITDFVMPGGMNGQELAGIVRQRYADLPMLIMSGYTDSVELDVEFLHKPFSLDELRQAISRAVAAEPVRSVSRTNAMRAPA